MKMYSSVRIYEKMKTGIRRGINPAAEKGSHPKQKPWFGPPSWAHHPPSQVAACPTFHPAHLGNQNGCVQKWWMGSPIIAIYGRLKMGKMVCWDSLSHLILGLPHCGHKEMPLRHATSAALALSWPRHTPKPAPTKEHKSRPPLPCLHPFISISLVKMAGNWEGEKLWVFQVQKSSSRASLMKFPMWPVTWWLVRGLYMLNPKS